ncbi:MAG: hypothetical protein ACHQ1D_02910 [Nitrososphaerales archaeon]
MKFNWEKIDFIENCQIRTWRAKILHGWIVRTESWSDQGLSESMVFIEDTAHKWEIE